MSIKRMAYFWYEEQMDKNAPVRKFDAGSVWLKKYCSTLRLQYSCVVEGVMQDMASTDQMCSKRLMAAIR
jgi:hypothetical protein